MGYVRGALGVLGLLDVGGACWLCWMLNYAGVVGWLCLGLGRAYVKMGQGITRVGEGVLTGWGKGLCRELVRGGCVGVGGRVVRLKEVKFLTLLLLRLKV